MLSDELNAALTQFLKGAKPPPRGKLFRLKYWLLAKLFSAGEWAGNKVQADNALTLVEKIYWSCAASNISPAKLRENMASHTDALITKAAQQVAARGGLVQ